VKSLFLATVGYVDPDAMTAVDASLRRAFGFEIKRMEPLEDPAYAFSQARGQFDSSSILYQLSRVVPADAIRLLAVTERDLFIPILSFIFGHAQFRGAVALVSLARLRQEFYRLAPDPPLMHSRAVKETLHEVGHTLGLVHCSDKACPMSLSTNIRQVDVKGSEFCASCALLVRENIHMLSRQNSSSLQAGGTE
jgi:archaemetzincin